MLAIALYLVILVALTPPLGAYMHRVYSSPKIGRVEAMLYRLIGVDATREQTWRRYAASVLSFSAVSMAFVYLILRLQDHLPMNPQGLPAVNPFVAFNTAASFMTNTNWQAYGGELTMSYLSQMLALTFQNFVSAAVGMAVLIAMVRGFSRSKDRQLGNFWRDLVRDRLHLPSALRHVSVSCSRAGGGSDLRPRPADAGSAGRRPDLARGPVARQIAIKQLGTNGGGFFNTNSAHPFENSTPFSNFLQALAILWIPAALTYTFGKMVGSRRQGWALFSVMFILLGRRASRPGFR